MSLDPASGLGGGSARQADEPPAEQARHQAPKQHPPWQPGIMRQDCYECVELVLRHRFSPVPMGVVRRPAARPVPSDAHRPLA
jgi:hypothetical protein